MKRKSCEVKDVNILLDAINNMSCHDGEDEYKLVLEACFAKWDEESHERNVYLVDKAEQRYKKYLREINLEEHEYLENQMYKFLYTKKCCTEQVFKLMKKIDRCIVDVIEASKEKRVKPE